MATLNPIQESPNPVPSGQTGTITLTFTVNPGSPDLTSITSIYKDGTLVATAPPVTLKGTPTESAPIVQNGSTNTGWEIRTDSGTLTSLGNNQFSIAYS